MKDFPDIAQTNRERKPAGKGLFIITLPLIFKNRGQSPLICCQPAELTILQVLIVPVTAIFWILEEGGEKSPARCTQWPYLTLSRICLEAKAAQSVVQG